ncbi:MAG: co-chaperone GroES [bacterium]|nr:co-chaperone GroES [bacterium]
MKIQPLDDRILVKQLEEEEEKIGNIYIPDTAKEKPQIGTIMAVGKGRMSDEGKLIPLDLKTGEKVIYAKYSGTEIKIKGTEYILLEKKDILAKLTD